MADFQADLMDVLDGHAALQALIAGRLYPNGAPPNPVAPFVIYYEFATPRVQGFGSGNPTMFSKPRIQYSIYAAGYGAAKAIADAIRDAVKGSGWPVVIEDERGNKDVTSGLNRRDIDVRIVHDGD